MSFLGPFAYIDKSDFTITTMNDGDEDDWSKFTALKKKKSSLKTYLSIGGWDLGGEVWSNLCRFPGSRKAFIKSAVETMKKYDFDGIDIDWEYPAAGDRGGTAKDTANLVTLLKELREEVKTSWGVTVTLPSSYWYLKGFDLKGMAEHLDFFNFMAYDIHGTWDGKTKWTSAVVNPHTNLTEVSNGLDLLWRNSIDPSQVLLGLGFYGRSFTLDDTSCMSPGCAFDKDHNSTGGAAAGQCTGTSGILSDYEINRIIKSDAPEIKYDEAAAVNWMTWNSDQWVSFDNERTLKQKADFANSRCLGGLFSWALDMGGPGSLKNPNSMDPSDTIMNGADTKGGSDGTGTLKVGSELFDSDDHEVTGIAPVNVIFPWITLPTPTAIPETTLSTSVEVAWETPKTVTSGTITTVTTTITRYVQDTVITVPPHTAYSHGFYNWNITQSNATFLVGTLWPSIPMPVVHITDDPNPLFESGVSHKQVTRTINIPPWPWHTDNENPTRITFTQGSPPGPTCTADCGEVCTKFCNGPCLNNCDDLSYSDFIDPLDDHPPSVADCVGPDCKNGECKDKLCIEKGCKGKGCQGRICTDDMDCEPTGCRGTDCYEGHCEGDDCQDHGCTGEDCDESSGRCIGFNCLAWGCIGLDCPPSGSGKFTCTGPNCRVVSCAGPDCDNGICKGEDCEPEDRDCEAQEAEVCTDWISSTLVTPASTHSTETVTTACKTITACEATPTTTTKTITDDQFVEATVSIIEYAQTLPADVSSAIESELMAYASDYWSAIGSTTSTKTTATTTTSSGGSEPTKAGYPNSFLIFKYHEEKDYIDASRKDTYSFYGAYYDYRQEMTEVQVCAGERKVAGPVDADEHDSYPSSLGGFDLGEYTGCKYTSPNGHPGHVTCENTLTEFDCLGFVKEKGTHVVDFGCGTSMDKAGTKTWKSYNKVIECSII
ncbi:unnamed protein product [Penicillium pancosmium]